MHNFTYCLAWTWCPVVVSVRHPQWEAALPECPQSVEPPLLPTTATDLNWGHPRWPLWSPRRAVSQEVAEGWEVECFHRQAHRLTWY